jgi:DNA-binding MarR family transcriptional regulator
MTQDAVAKAVAAFRELASSLDGLDQGAAERLGVGRSDLRCLDVLSQRDNVTAGELAHAVGLSPAALSAALRRLQARGYIVREHAEHDRRTVYVRMTETAAELTAQSFAAVHALTVHALSGLNPGELSTVANVARNLAAAITASLQHGDTDVSLFVDQAAAIRGSRGPAGGGR